MSTASPSSSTHSTTLSERLTAAIAHSRRTKRDVELEAHLTKGYLSTLTAGKRGVRNGIGPDMLRRLSEALGVSFEWLATGEGHMMRSGEAPPPRRPSPTPFSAANPAGDVDFAERYPVCERTIQFLKEVEGISPAVARLARAIALQLPFDLEHKVWHQLILDIHEKYAAEEARQRPISREPIASREPASSAPQESGDDLDGTLEVPRPTVSQATVRTPLGGGGVRQK